MAMDRLVVFIGCDLQTYHCAYVTHVSQSISCSFSYFSLSPYHFLLSLSAPSLSFFLYICAHEFMCVLMYVYVQNVCVQRLIIINGLNILWGFTHLVSPMSLRHLWDSAHSAAHIQITQPAEVSWMTSALLSNTQTIYTFMYACTHTKKAHTHVGIHANM